MRQIIFLAFFLPFVGIGQMTDTTCIQFRWIALKPTEKNARIFLLDTLYREELDMVNVIKRLTESGSIWLYHRGNEWNLSNKWYPINYQEELENALRDSFSLAHDPFFEIAQQSDVPLTDDYGDPLVITHPDGSQEFVYPHPEIFVFPAWRADEIRIKEERVWNDASNRVEYRAVGLSFFFRNRHSPSEGFEKFWIDLNQLYENLDNPERYPWYKALRSGDYSGFQYMQVSCFDELIRY
jgi:hypothetical protein